MENPTPTLIVESADRHCRRHLGRPVGGVPAVAAPLPFRSFGVAVALVHLVTFAGGEESFLIFEQLITVDKQRG